LGYLIGEMRSAFASRISLLLGAVAVVGLSLLTLPAPAAAAGCANADRAPSRSTLPEVARAVECEINRRRRARGLPRLDLHGRLREASERHARDMVRRSYFSHVSRDGRSMTARLRDAGYIRRDRRWAAGEVLAWGSFRRSTAARAVANWMDSPPHRRVLLNPRYRDVGVGVALGTPLDGRTPGATFAAALGYLSR
jgi:uncharacterized protein YkwD